MSHLLKRTKKSCIKLIRKLSTKQIFLKRLEEEDISTDIEPSVEATEKPNNQNSNTTPKNAVTRSYQRQSSKKEAKDSPKHKQNKNGKTLKHLDEDDDEEDETPDTDILQSLTSKLFLTADGYEFQRLEQLRSDTASEIIPFDANYTNTHNNIKKPPSSFADDINLEVVFEKVKYKEDVRYFRHTPSTASLDNYFINDQELNLITSNNTHTSNCPNGNSENNNSNNNISNNNHNHNNNNNSNAINLNNPIFTNRGLEMTHHNYFNSQHNHHHLNNHLLPVNVSLGCKSDGNYHQFIIGQERDCFYKLTPVVKWDINGNSLEDDMDNFHCFSINSNNSPAKSSLRSSSTTLETWLEDE
ncbi:homeobox protein 2 [Lucilia cuprina]|uniref:homeobox protein 2 n=1 Tax=Lucilia cuprina TaxID=7375 RepID=UPI001F06AF17|nr:homeobox protein 2 [Lucilia cuprina]